MHAHLARLALDRAVFRAQRSHWILLSRAGRKKRRRVFPVGAKRAVVAGRNVDGRDNVRRRYSAGCHGMVARGGIAGNWLWWSFVASGMLTVFFYARLWRRSGVMTDIEFAEIRYSGRPAAFLRGFRALYLGIPVNCIILGWVNLAMVKILRLALGVTRIGALAHCAGTDRDYVDDLDAFGLMGRAGDRSGAIRRQDDHGHGAGGVRGPRGRRDGRAEDEAGRARPRARGACRIGVEFHPRLDSPWMPMITFFVYISLNWWATWYPGAEPGGGGYIAQRMFCAKDEKNSLLATLWFNIAHYALRPWPWILVALVSLVVFPGLQDPESGIRPRHDRLSAGVPARRDAGGFRRGVHVHYRDAAQLGRKLHRERFLPAIRAAESARPALRGVSQMDHGAADDGFHRGDVFPDLDRRGVENATGHRRRHRSVLLLRWYWWRINAWSEISAMIAASVTSLALQIGGGLDTDKPVDFAWIMIITVSDHHGRLAGSDVPYAARI